MVEIDIGCETEKKIVDLLKKNNFVLTNKYIRSEKVANYLFKTNCELNI